MFDNIDNLIIFKTKMIENKNKNIALHFRCYECNATQKTHWFENTKDIVSMLVENGEIPTLLHCKWCKSITHFLDINNTFGIET